MELHVAPAERGLRLTTPRDHALVRIHPEEAEPPAEELREIVVGDEREVGAPTARLKQQQLPLGAQLAERAGELETEGDGLLELAVPLEIDRAPRAHESDGLEELRQLGDVRVGHLAAGPGVAPSSHSSQQVPCRHRRSRLMQQQRKKRARILAPVMPTQRRKRAW